MKLHDLQQAIDRGEAEQAHRYLDQAVNNLGTIYGPWENISTVDRRYGPDPDQSFQLPYAILSDGYEVVTATPSGSLLSAIHCPDGVRYFWHPENAGAARKYRQAGSLAVVATSSTRTVMTTDQDPNFMIKTSLPKSHFFYDRTLTAATARYSVAVSGEIERTGLPEGIAYSPEPLALLHEGEGLVFREFQPRPHVDESRLLIPGFSLAAQDPAAPGDQPLLADIVSQNAPKDKLGYFIETFVAPIQDAWITLLTERGLLLDAHGQNCMFELRPDRKVGRLVIKDFQSVYVDAAKRDELGLPQIWDDYFPQSERSTQYSVSYDHMMGIMLFDGLVKVLSSAFPEYTPEKVQQQIANRFRKAAGYIAQILPPTIHRLRGTTGASTELRTIDTGDAAVYR